MCICFTHFPQLFSPPLPPPPSKCCFNPTAYLHCTKGNKDIGSRLGPREEWAHLGSPGLFSYFQVNWLANLILWDRHMFWGCRHGHLWKAVILPTNDGNVQCQCCLIQQPLATCGYLNLIERKTSSSVPEITSLHAWHTVMPINTRHNSLEQRKIYYRFIQRDGWLMT